MYYLRLHSIRIQGFRKHYDTTVYFDQCSFIIGMNNMGKSSIFKAIDILLSDIKKIDKNDFYGIVDELNNNVTVCTEVILAAEFRNCPIESKQWRGLKGRIFNYPKEDEEDTGLSLFYRKTFVNDANVKIEIKQNVRNVNDEYLTCRTKEELIGKGFPEQVLEEEYPEIPVTAVLTAKQKKQLESVDEYYIYDEENEEWFENPGGIPGVVLSKLPNFLLIPAQDKIDEISGNNGTLLKTLNNLFEDVRNSSTNFIEAQKHLSLLEQELDPNDDEKEFGKMMKELNGVLGDVFPNTALKANANLSNPDKSIKPTFDISMVSNYNTPVVNQGTGVVRAAVFAMLRYRDMRENAQNNNSLIIGFEEPEIYLHPNAANQMRETIYNLASNPKNQLICTTHSPYMIDLSKSTKQVLTHLKSEVQTLEDRETPLEIEKIIANPFNLSKGFKALTAEDKTYVKMILKMDEYVAKAFFATNVLIVEGDTEDIVLKETFKRLPENVKNEVYQNWNIIKARGKAAIIPLLKYFNAMGIKPYVMHDKDEGVERAMVFNKPIADLVDGDRLFIIQNCIEDILGYPSPTKEKPFTAYKYIEENWGNDWTGVQENWQELIEMIFNISVDTEEVEINQ